MFNGIWEAALILFDTKYTDDETFFAEPSLYADDLAEEEWDILLNMRAYAREMMCVHRDCGQPMWAVHNEVIHGIKDGVPFARLLVEYVCSEYHDGQYEAIPLCIPEDK